MIAYTPRHARRRTDRLERLLTRIGRAVVAAVTPDGGATSTPLDVLGMSRAEAVEPPVGEYRPARVVRPADEVDAPVPYLPTDAAKAVVVEPVIPVRADQVPLVLDLMRARQQSAGHQVHRTPDAPCSCCAHLDYELAGVIDDEGAAR